MISELRFPINPNQNQSYIAIMRRRYERRRAAKAKAAAAAAEKDAPSAAIGASGPVEAVAAANATPKKRQTTVHAAAQIKLHVHGHEFQNGEEIILNPDSFPQLKDLIWKDYAVEVFHPELAVSDGAAAALAEGSPQNHLLLEIPESSAAPLKGKMQVSVLKDTAAIFQLAPFKDVTVRFLPKTQVEVDFVEVSLKDQFMSRRDLMYLKQSMVGTALYVGKTIRVQGTRWQVLDVRSGGEKVRSGVVSENTKFTFRSRTSRIMWLVQISPEMWDMANSGMLYLEIFLTVVRNVLNKWMKHKVSHSLTILFYSRCFYPEMDQDQENSTSGGHFSHRRFMPTRKQSRAADDERESSFPYERSDCFSVGVDEDGRHYQDFYKLVAFDSIITDVQPLLVKLKEEMNAFPRECGWRSPADFYVSSFSPAELLQDDPGPRPGVPSNARDGNLLEAVNLVLNIFEKHHIDRDLSRSGQSVVLITPGNGIFSVNKRLSEITEQRMMDHGIGIDLISLASRPLHKCPLFLFKQSDLSEMKLPGRKEGNLANEMCLCNNNPHGSKHGYQRRSRTGSSDALTDSQSAVADMGVSSMRTGQLCKYCLQRMENRKNYIVPLWIPLWFVQENMLTPHECPLDEDISQFCDVCAPKNAKSKVFEPLPMCRMFKDNDFTHFGYLSLPKPLECLLNDFQNAESALSDDDRDNADFSVAPSVSGSTYDNVMLAGLNSDLVRARASSMACSDDSLSYDGEVVTKIRTFSLSEQSKLLQEYERYDDEVFGFAPAPKLGQKSSDSDISVRLASTPPIRPGVSYLSSMIKKRTGTIGFQSGSAGNENGGSNSGGAHWRTFEQREPSPLNVDMAEYRGSLEAKVGSLDDDKDKPKITSSSFPNTFQLADGSGPGHTSFTASPVLRPADGAVKEDIFHSQAFMLKQLTSNQRRWSQVRPNEDQQYKIAQNVLKWKSLCFPALLPLASDFLPAPKELKAHYTESFYSVMLPERDEQNGVTFRDYRELVLEMVAQRLSQDFQLVSGEDSNEVGEKDGSVFRLSMGHRIHEIVYNEETQTIDVKRFLQKVTTRSDVDIMEYRYSLWSPIVDRFVTVAQEFRKYPQIEYQWNHLDQLICGYIDDMSEGIRYKRSLYCLLPPRLGGSDVGDQENLRDYTEGCRKFLEFLRAKADASTGFPDVKLSTNWRENISTSGTDAFKRVGQRSVKMLLHTNDAVTSQNWVIAKVDTEVLPTQCYHVEIQWLVCRSSLVDDLVTGMSRRAKQLGLELQRVTENGISSNLDLHPLNCPIFLKIDDASERRMVEKALIERFDFCCEALHPIPFTHLNHNAEYAILAQEPRPPRARRMISYYRQYVHRSLACFARMTQTGLVWISNQKVHDDEIQPIFDELRYFIESLQVARSALMGVLDDMFEPAVTAAAPSPMPAKTSEDLLQPQQTFGVTSTEEDSAGIDKKLAMNTSASVSTNSCNEEEKENSPEAINVVVRTAVNVESKRESPAMTAEHGVSRMMAIAAEDSSPSARNARVAPGNLFRRMSAQAMGMEAAALCHRSHWVPKSSRSNCSNCRRSFRLWAGKHHCRLCGEIVCGACSTKRILFQKKSVRTCDDCVDANVQNISEINRRRSTPEFVRSHTSPAAFGSFDDRYERRSLQISSRGLHRHNSSFASTGSSRGVNIIKKEAEDAASSKQTTTVMKYRVTFSWQTQVMSLVIAALVLSIACALKLMARV
ncbi:DEP domain-containing protein [Phytophthora citrophthora]|uniref:DEP domain-containing protein n=1 Tax=Phytophthora citrophthora TaxID=4793 RepID=A0AAD9GDR9_9STRA|nr:DEP domain-containing protein [Phytophthora citrophthora]